MLNGFRDRLFDKVNKRSGGVDLDYGTDSDDDAADFGNDEHYKAEPSHHFMDQRTPKAIFPMMLPRTTGPSHGLGHRCGLYACMGIR